MFCFVSTGISQESPHLSQSACPSNLVLWLLLIGASFKWLSLAPCFTAVLDTGTACCFRVCDVEQATRGNAEDVKTNSVHLPAGSSWFFYQRKYGRFRVLNLSLTKYISDLKTFYVSTIRNASKLETFWATERRHKKEHSTLDYKWQITVKTGNLLSVPTGRKDIPKPVQLRFIFPSLVQDCPIQAIPKRIIINYHVMRPGLSTAGSLRWAKSCLGYSL